MIALLERLQNNRELTKEEWCMLLEAESRELSEEVFRRARKVREQYYKRDVYIRGLIEFTNYCKNDCYYCGIRRSNERAGRYRLSKEEILACCKTGYDLGFRTFVLQGGEDGHFTDDVLMDILREIKKQFNDCAITLSVGERSYESYKKLYDAGADRYLLRHETFCEQHYAYLHPKQLSAKERQSCLWNLKEIGYQVGTGFMVGSPGQKKEHLAEDLLFIQRLKPHMIGIGPFLPHHQTPFGGEPGGSVALTLYLLGLLRLLIPEVLLPATTALGTASNEGRTAGILAGANVIMPNLSPMQVRGSYSLYDHKKYTGEEAAEGLSKLKKEMERIGYHVVTARGDSLVGKEGGQKDV